MNKSILRRLLLVMMIVIPLLAAADEGAVMHRLLFHSGRVVVGEIVLRNNEVVIVKDAYGARFQFPLTDIVEITEILEQEPEQKQEEKSSRSVTNVKRTSLGIRVAGGLVSMDGSLGGAIAADFRLGANNLAGKHIFLGGQVGYRAMMVEKRTLSVLPIDVVLELPLTEFEHTPMLGANIGYGIGIGGGIRGGVNAGLTLAYRYQFSRTGAFHIGLEAEVQQLASVPHQITVETGQNFSASTGRTAIMGMLTVGILF